MTADSYRTKQAVSGLPLATFWESWGSSLSTQHTSDVSAGELRQHTSDVSHCQPIIHLAHCARRSAILLHPRAGQGRQDHPSPRANRRHTRRRWNQAPVEQRAPLDRATDEGFLPLSTSVTSSRSFNIFRLNYSLDMCGAEAAHETMIHGNLKDQSRRRVRLHLQGTPLQCFSAPFGLEFLLDSGAFGFLIMSWVADNGGGSYSKTPADSFHRKMLEQQRHLQMGGTSEANVGFHSQPGTTRLSAERTCFQFSRHK